MIRSCLLLVFLPLAACSRDGRSAPATPPPAPQSGAPTTRVEPAPGSARKPSPVPEAALAPASPPRNPETGTPDFGVHLPAFTFRTMDGKPAKVQLNGEDMSTTPCLWSITQNLKFTDAAVPGGWPPEGGRRIGSTQRPDDPSSTAELYVVDRPELLAKIPGLRKGECVLAVRGRVGGCPVQGSLLLHVRDYRFVDYIPLVDPEGEDASRFRRTLWFERMPDE